MALDLTSLEKAVNSLERGIKVASALSEGADPDQKEIVRAGVIQNFEFTYELCWKFMKRWLEMNGEGPSIDGASKKELFRIASERRLIDNIEAWFRYAEARNLTSHTYDGETANDIYETAKVFLADAKHFLDKLKEKND